MELFVYFFWSDFTSGAFKENQNTIELLWVYRRVVVNREIV